MPHYYRGPRIHISHRVFEAWDPVYRVYAIEDLRDAWTVKRRKPVRRGAIRRACSRGGVGAAVVALAHGLFPGREGELVAAVLVVLATGVAVGAGVVVSGRKRRIYELWALHKNVPVRLIVSGDPTSFNQVCRALQRALEWHRDLGS